MEDDLRRMKRTATRILSSGVALSGSLIVLGLILAYTSGNTSSPYGGAGPRWLLFGDPFLSPSHVLFMGFLVLLATPVLNVAASAYLFIRERDGALALITSFVLLVLLLGFTV